MTDIDANDEKLFEAFRSHAIWAEAKRNFPYEDTVGKVTIGIGRNLDDVGLSDAEVDYLFTNDYHRTLSEAQRFPWFEDLNEARKLVVMDMIFNLGLKRFSGFVRTIAAIEAQNYEAAAAQMLDSKWARQVGRRAQLNAITMKTGKYPR